MAVLARVVLVMLSFAGPAAADLQVGRRRRPGQKTRLKVVTDMGMDDWGAFASLHAAGMDPEAILATNGMMTPSEFYLTFQEFLRSWGVRSPLYQGTEGMEHCFEPGQCLNTSFVDDWHYRRILRSFFQSPMPPVPEVPVADASFWTHGGCSPKYTLLVLSPVSDVASALNGNSDITQCIERIVLAGGTFKGSELKKTDPMTGGALIAVDDSGDFDASGGNLVELNVAADAPAAAALLGMGVPVTIVPLEVDSIARPGLQTVQPEGEVTTEQLDEIWFQNQYLMQGLCKGGRHPRRPSMLQHMACIHKGRRNDVNSMDMDAITAAYLWSQELFVLETKGVKVNNVTGATSVVTSGCQGDDHCHEVQVATGFNAIAWVQKLSSMI